MKEEDRINISGLVGKKARENILNLVGSYFSFISILPTCWYSSLLPVAFFLFKHWLYWGYIWVYGRG